MGDARAGAWMAAATLLEAADDLVRQHGDVALEIAELTVRRADVYSRLAAVDGDVGKTVAAVYEKQEQQKKRSAFQEALFKKRGGGEEDGGTASPVRDSDDQPTEE